MNLATKINHHIPVKNPKKNFSTPEEATKEVNSYQEKISDRFGDSFVLAATEILGITGEASEKLKVTCYADIFDTCKFSQYFEETNNPQVGSLALYLNKNKNKLKHAAVVTQITPNHPELCMVKGKWGNHPAIIEHKLLDTPNELHGDIYFYHPKNEFKNKKDLLALMQEDLKKSQLTKDMLNKAQNVLIDLASGKNASSNSIPSAICLLEQNKSIYDNALNLLKNVVGLDINTRTKVNNQTVSMLAAKRDDAELVCAFLAMGANGDTQDNDGNTVLHLAVQHNAHKTLSVLLMHENINKTIKNSDGLTAYDLAIKNNNTLATIIFTIPEQNSHNAQPCNQQ